MSEYFVKDNEPISIETEEGKAILDYHKKNEDCL